MNLLLGVLPGSLAFVLPSHHLETLPVVQSPAPPTATLEEPRGEIPDVVVPVEGIVGSSNQPLIPLMPLESIS